MIIDTSAFLAIAMGEDRARDLAERIVRAAEPRLPVHCRLEAHIVVTARKGPAAREILTALAKALDLSGMDLTDAHAAAACAAYDRFGKGRHPAGLNFGDCLSYGVAKVEGQPLLFVGEDFAKTDIVAAGQG
ncbi:MAG: type II toxin-antitoxin system VapC family toxin [Alphaproteobacteria bacterium]|nr:MAG: type II toxin-antitoxin system VapC family toxin [Alphaproteobacteria bacterium]